MFKGSTINKILFSVLLSTLITTARAQQPVTYPKITGYFSIINPIGTLTEGHFHSNFGDVYNIGFPFGMNILKSDKFGVSFEVAPTIRTEKNISKVSNVLFHPGAMFRFKRGFTFVGRVAFESNGRFGFTPVFNQVIKKGKDASMFLSVPFPVRFGNDLPVSLSTGLQVGVSF